MCVKSWLYVSVSDDETTRWLLISNHSTICRCVTRSLKKFRRVNYVCVKIFREMSPRRYAKTCKCETVLCRENKIKDYIKNESSPNTLEIELALVCKRASRKKPCLFFGRIFLRRRTKLATPDFVLWAGKETRLEFQLTEENVPILPQMRFGIHMAQRHEAFAYVFVARTMLSPNNVLRRILRFFHCCTPLVFSCHQDVRINHTWNCSLRLFRWQSRKCVGTREENCIFCARLIRPFSHELLPFFAIVLKVYNRWKNMKFNLEI